MFASRQQMGNGRIEERQVLMAGQVVEVERRNRLVAPGIGRNLPRTARNLLPGSAWDTTHQKLRGLTLPPRGWYPRCGHDIARTQLQKIAPEDSGAKWSLL
jgi:hypothetical protein